MEAIEAPASSQFLDVERLPCGAVDRSEPVVIRMVKTMTVTVEVMDTGGKPIAGQSVSIEPIGNTIGKWSGGGTTDAQGKAVIEGVPPGEYQVTDRAYSEKRGKVFSVSEGKPVNVEVSW